MPAHICAHTHTHTHTHTHAHTHTHTHTESHSQLCILQPKFKNSQWTECQWFCQHHSWFSSCAGPVYGCWWGRSHNGHCQARRREAGHSYSNFQEYLHFSVNLHTNTQTHTHTHTHTHTCTHTQMALQYTHTHTHTKQQQDIYISFENALNIDSWIRIHNGKDSTCTDVSKLKHKWSGYNYLTN